MLYYSEPYLTEIEAKIMAKKDGLYLLDKTILYPGGGGQPPDRGTAICNGQEHDIVHVGDGWHRISGTCEGKLKIKLDWNFRYYMMKSHTAEHAFFRVLQNKGAVLGKANFGEESSLTFTGDIDIDDILDAEAKVKELIANEVKVTTFWIAKNEIEDYPELRINLSRIRDDRIRVVNIESHDTTACKGIHVSNMSEIEDFAVTRFRAGRKKEIKFVVAERAKEFHNNLSRDFRRIAWTHGLELAKIGRFMENLIAENGNLKDALKSASAEIPFKTESCGSLKFYSLLFYGAERKIMVRRMMELVNNEDAVVVYGDLSNNAVMCAFSNPELKDIIMKAITDAGGRGGGKGNFVSGAVSGPEKFVADLKKLLCSGDIHLHGDENGD